MKKILTYLLFLVITIISTESKSQTTEADKLMGEWLSGSGKAHIKITKYGEKYMGKICWLKEPLNEQGKPKMDKNNPDESKKTVPLMGLTNLVGFKYKGSKTWEDGTIYDPESGNTYKCTIKMIDENTITVRGYVGVSLLGRTDTWKRVQSK